MSKAYLVAFVQISDFEQFKNDYIIPSAPILAKYGGVLLTASNEVEVKEESVPTGWGILIEFPSLEMLNAFYDDPDYVSLIEVRRAQGGSALAFFPQGITQGG